MHEQDIQFFAPEYQKILGKRNNLLVVANQKCTTSLTRSNGKTANELCFPYDGIVAGF